MSLIVANWKMSLGSLESRNLAKEIVEFVRANKITKDVVICPSFPMLNDIKEITKGSNISLGAQDCSANKPGSYTGDVSAYMLKECGCEYVILGHSERRAYHRETSEIVRKKAGLAQEAGLKTIICIGESEDDHKNGVALDVLSKQMQESIPENTKDLIIAYEPVWAIGSGKTPSIMDISKVVKFIDNQLSLTFSIEKKPIILYGGSVKPSNSLEISSIQGLSGMLIGGASLIAKDFNEILQAG